MKIGGNRTARGNTVSATTTITTITITIIVPVSKIDSILYPPLMFDAVSFPFLSIVVRYQRYQGDLVDTFLFDEPMMTFFKGCQRDKRPRAILSFDALSNHVISKTDGKLKEDRYAILGENDNVGSVGVELGQKVGIDFFRRKDKGSISNDQRGHNQDQEHNHLETNHIVSGTIVHDGMEKVSHRYIFGNVLRIRNVILIVVKGIFIAVPAAVVVVVNITAVVVVVVDVVVAAFTNLNRILILLFLYGHVGNLTERLTEIRGRGYWRLFRFGGRHIDID
mmetsp:Transcript_121861/g.181944  ORF Transcript_121861/g.181944 Transcript_121861/m.181944 type:complete len:279 (-) Transcript_121861:144-980(-)